MAEFVRPYIRRNQSGMPSSVSGHVRNEQELKQEYDRIRSEMPKYSGDLADSMDNNSVQLGQVRRLGSNEAYLRSLQISIYHYGSYLDTYRRLVGQGRR